MSRLIQDSSRCTGDHLGFVMQCYLKTSHNELLAKSQKSQPPLLGGWRQSSWKSVNMIPQQTMYLMSRVMRKPAFCICENKGEIHTAD